MHNIFDRHQLYASCLFAVLLVVAFAGCERTEPAATPGNGNDTGASASAPASKPATTPSDLPVLPDDQGGQAATESDATDRARRNDSGASSRQLAKQIRQYCKSNNLPDPPTLKDVPVDLLRLLDDTLHQAARDHGEQAMGRAALIYHAVCHSREDTDRAVAMYEQVKKLAPDSYQWPHYLGRLFVGRESYERARMEFEQSLRLNPDYPMNYAWIGEVELARGDTDEAIKQFTKYMESVDDTTYGQLGLAAAYLDAERYDDFFAAVGAIRRTVGDCGRIRMLLAKYHDKMEQPAAADAERRAAESLPAIPGGIRFDPLEIQMWRALGDTSPVLGKIQKLIAQGDLQSALILTDAILADHPDSPAFIEASMVICDRANLTDRALTAANKLLKTQPTNPAALTVTAGILLKTERFDDLLTVAKRALDANDAFAPAYACRALASAGLQRYDEAEQAMAKAITLSPNNALFLESMSNILIAQKKYDDAKGYLEKMLELDVPQPTRGDVRVAAHLTLADVEFTRGNIDAAFDYLTQAVSETPNALRVLRPLIEQALARDRVSDTAAFLEKILQTDPKLKQTRLSLVELLGRSGDLSRAMVLLRDGLTETPNSVRLHFALARLLRTANKLDEAADELQKVIKLRPDMPAPYAELASVHLLRSDEDRALSTARDAVKRFPHDPALANTLAWILATTPDDAVRDPKQALKWATQACNATANRNANFIDTLATAQAAAGDFSKAVATEKKAIELAQSKPAGADLGSMQERLKLFESNKPFTRTD